MSTHNSEAQEKSRDEFLTRSLLEESQKFEEFYRWLQMSMPSSFFQEVPKEGIFRIIHTLMAFRLHDFYSEIHLKDITIALTLDSPEADLRILEGAAVYGIKSYTTYISHRPLPFPDMAVNLRIATVQFTQPFFQEVAQYDEAQKKELVAAFRKKHPEAKEEAFDALLEKIDPKFLRSLPLHRQILVGELFLKAKESDLCQYEVEYENEWQKKETSSMTLILAWKNTPKYNFLYRLARLVYNHSLIMQKANMAYIDSYEKEGIFLLSIQLHGMRNQAADAVCDIDEFLQELVLLKYFGSFDIFDEVFVQTRLLRGNLAHLLRTLRYFIHQMLVHVDPNFYSLSHIEEDLCRHPELTVKLLEAFEMKFSPKKANIQNYKTLKNEFHVLVNQIDTGDEHIDKRRKNTLIQGMNFVEFSLKTNFYVKNKTALGFRIDGAILDHVPFDRKKVFPEIPYGIFFMKGMHFFGFHIRFRDLARGGLRTVFPDRKERVLAEINNVFQECYNLALTQQKKNKDIPEGGAKGVIFLKPNERLEEETRIFIREFIEAGFSKEIAIEKSEGFKSEQKREYLYQTQRSFVSSFLSLINCDERGLLKESLILDYLKRPEYIYLGPDENLHDAMIEWIANESRKVGYRPKGAFISGKPRLGINHKEYGVTSLGVMVFMHEVLKFLGIDPYQHSFTVKMTGGPDGDVAGNMIHNLFLYYNKTAQLLALTDVSGTIYDPQGLDLAECNRLFVEGKSINHYPPHLLHSGGFLLDLKKKKGVTAYSLQTLLWKKQSDQLEEHWISGNEMNALYRHNVHSVITDVFLPCGGRPKSLHEANVQEFLDEEGHSTSKAIIEGANLYLTQGARRFLETKGVIIIKDSSANKGGVITSSFEILAGLTLTDEEFLQNKSEIVKEILERVKLCSFDEATLLLNTKKEKKAFLTDISEIISEKINLYTDQLLSYFEKGDSLKDTDPLITFYLEYALEVLKKKYRQKLLSEVPDNHKKAIIATSIACQLVYERGVDWAPTIIDILPLIHYSICEREPRLIREGLSSS